MTASVNTKIDVDAYIAGFPDKTRLLLQQMRTTILKTVPEAEELISWNMPAYKYHGALVYFAGYKNHIGFYPTPSGIESFKKQISIYKNAKGSVQFPLDQPLPVKLITNIVLFRKKKNLEKAAFKKKSKIVRQAAIVCK